jgi:hypothetical protein
MIPGREQGKKGEDRRREGGKDRRARFGRATQEEHSDLEWIQVARFTSCLL